jgi:hypothetical protein
MFPEDKDTPRATNWDRATLNEKRTTMLIWEADDAELQLLIDTCDEFTLQAARKMTVGELRARFQRPAW